MASKTSGSVGVAWGGAGASNGPSTQPSGRITSAADVLRRKGSASAASPTASPHLQAHDPTRLQEEWPSLADTAAPAPAPTPAPATQTAGRRNRRKKERQTAQLFPPQSQEEADTTTSPPAHPVTPPQDPSPSRVPAPAPSASPSQAPAPTPTATPVPTPTQTQQSPVTSPPAAAAQQRERLTPQGAPVLQVDDNTPLCAVAAMYDFADRSRPQAKQEGQVTQDPLSLKTFAPETVAASAKTSSPTGSSSSMFSNPFFSSNGAASTSTTAPVPPGFGDLSSASVASTLVPPAVASPPAAAVATLSSPQKVAGAQPVQSFIGEHFVGLDVFNEGMFSSSAIGGGLFAGDPGAGASSSTGKTDPASSRDASSRVIVHVAQGLLAGRSSSSQGDPTGSPSLQPTDAEVSVAGLLKPTSQGAGNGVTEGNSMSFSPASVDAATAAGSSPFGAAFGGGHFGGAFGSALFPVSSHQAGGGMHGNGVGETDGPGADLSVDPFANSSGALAAMLGVTLPPVDSQSSLASKMRSGTGDSRMTSGHEMSPQRTLTPSQRRYDDFAPDGVRGREGVGHGRGGHRQGFVREEGGVGGANEALQGSGFPFAQGLNPGLPFSPARGSPAMGPDPRGSPPGVGSPPHLGARHHVHHHHQSHAHRPFGGARPLSPPELGEFAGPSDGQFPPHHHHRHRFQHQQQQQQLPPQQQQSQQQQPQQGYSIQNGMAFLQKVLPGVSLSYGDRHPPAGAGGGHGQQGQGASGAPSGRVGWGDNAAGQRVDPAQAFGSTLWTMAPAPNAPRQPQGSRGSGYGAW